MKRWSVSTWAARVSSTASRSIKSEENIMTLTNPVADTSQNALTFPAKVLSVDLSGNAMAAAPAAASADGVAGTAIQEIAVGGYNGSTVDRLLADGGVLRVSLQAQKTFVTGSAAVAANTSNSAALPAVSAKTNYITGFSVTTQGGTGAAAGAVTITGTITGTLTFEV